MITFFLDFSLQELDRLISCSRLLFRKGHYKQTTPYSFLKFDQSSQSCKHTFASRLLSQGLVMIFNALTVVTNCFERITCQNDISLH